MEANNNTSPPLPTLYEVKVEHALEHKPEAKDFTIDFGLEIFQRPELSPGSLQAIYFSTTVHDFIWEDEDCPEKVELYESLIDARLSESEAQDILNDFVIFVSRQTLSLEDDYKGVFTLDAEVRFLPEPVTLNHVGSGQTHQCHEPIVQVRRWLTPGRDVKKSEYKIGTDGVSLVKVHL